MQIAGRRRKLVEAVLVSAFEAGEEPPDSAKLACLAALRAAIEARDVFFCAETALARDAAAVAYLRASGVPLSSFGPSRLVDGEP